MYSNLIKLLTSLIGSFIYSFILDISCGCVSWDLPVFLLSSAIKEIWLDFYSTSSSPLLLRGALEPATFQMQGTELTLNHQAPLQVHYYSRLQHWYCVGVNMLKRYRQLWVKDLPKVPTWWLEWDSNPQPSRCKAPNLPLNHQEKEEGVSLSGHLELANI